MLSVGLVIAAARLWVRTGVFREPRYWVSMVIVLFFQVLTDGWLTKRSAPIVVYRRSAILGLRVPFDIPVEDYLFGFSLVSLTILLWSPAGRGRSRAG